MRYILFELACDQQRTPLLPRGSQTTYYPQMRVILESVHEAHLTVLTELFITLMVNIIPVQSLGRAKHSEAPRNSRTFQRQLAKFNPFFHCGGFVRFYTSPRPVFQHEHLAVLSFLIRVSVSLLTNTNQNVIEID